jgi:hypothetical protein
MKDLAVNIDLKHRGHRLQRALGLVDQTAPSALPARMARGTSISSEGGP